MDNLPLRVTDDFNGSQLHPRWVAGFVSNSRQASFGIHAGFRIQFTEGPEYASAGIALRVPVAGDFDVRVRFEVTRPTAGTAFEVAAVAVDPPRESALDPAEANPYTLSRIYDVHGAPPYVSSEFDEDDGWRISWNRSSAQVKPRDGELIADNHFNRYGMSTRHEDKAGWLRLVRTGDDWTSYRRREGEGWVRTGVVAQMNLPRAVFLRLAAKHWVKKPATLAPANAVVFKAFELRTGVGLAAQTDHEMSAAIVGGIPTAAVTPLVDRTRSLRGCRKCDAFWGNTAYGPFVQIGPVEEDGRAQIRGFSHPEPATLYGCRKAPIMLIGINPNLPGHFIVPRSRDAADRRGGSYRVMPHFASDLAYATHYRHRPPPSKDLIDPAELEALLATHGQITATGDGQLVPDDGEMGGSYRVAGQRRVRLAIKYDDSERIDLREVTWQRDESFAIVRGRFRKGEVIAGLLTADAIGKRVKAVDTGSAASGAGYYDRAERLLRAVQTMLPGAKLELGEDMSLHDAVACASPQWNAREFAIDQVRSRCVEDMRWMHQDLIECAPEVVVLAGRTALALFAQPAEGRLSTALEALPERAGGRDGLFATVAEKGLWWTYRVSGTERTVRVIVAPHFSYRSNFRPHCYFSETDWSEFSYRHGSVARRLEAEARVEGVFGTLDKQVNIEQADNLWPQVERADMAAAMSMRKRWIEPFEFLAEAVVDGLRERGVKLAEGTGRLTRSRDGCDFCENAHWTLGAGCAYAGKAAP